VNFLDSDGNLLRAGHGKVALRDIVQFVPFNTVVKTGSSRELTMATLAELPGQVCDFFFKNGISPNQRLAATVVSSPELGVATAVALPPAFGYGQEGTR
jgi:hypothetical protein